jgi:hypothetical protein
MERGKEADGGKVKSDTGEVAWAVPLQRGLAAPAGVQNAGIANRMNAERPAHRNSARSAALR